MEEIKGYVEHIVYRNEDNGYTVFNLNNEDGDLTCVGTFLYIEEWFSLFPSKEMTIHKILDGTAERYSDTTVMHFHTAKLLAEIGYSSEVYELIKDTKITHPHATMVIELAEQLKKSNIR